MKNLDNYVKAIPDFPKPGILFRDVTGILESPDGFQLSLDKAVGILADVEFDLVAAPESRGFIFGAALADRFRTAFVPIRKPGKLPRETISESYDLEYGTATLHMHTDAVKPGQRVVIVDDLLATGGRCCSRSNSRASRRATASSRATTSIRSSSILENRGRLWRSTTSVISLATNTSAIHGGSRHR